MAAMAIQAGAGDQAKWITPEQQLEKWIKPNELVIAELAGTRQRPGPLPVWEVAFIVAEYAADNLSPNLTNWHIALERLTILPDKIPPLPLDIHDEVSDIKVLYLIPPGSLNELEACVSAYGQEHLAEYGGKNPLRFRYFWPVAREEYGETRFDEWQWILISKGLLVGSRNQPYAKQAQMVVKLSERAFVHYEVPSLKAAVALAFLHKVATGESVLQAGDTQNQHRYTYTRVRETTRGYRLAVGGFASDGLRVTGTYFDDHFIGVAALRKLD